MTSKAIADYRAAVVADIHSPRVAGIVNTYLDTWVTEWRVRWRNGSYTPWPAYMLHRLDQVLMAEAEAAQNGVYFMNAKGLQHYNGREITQCWIDGASSLDEWESGHPDRSYPEHDGQRGGFRVVEWLQPESRGWIEHHFTDREAAMSFYRGENHDGVPPVRD